MALVLALAACGSQPTRHQLRSQPQRLRHRVARRRRHRRIDGGACIDGGSRQAAAFPIAAFAAIREDPVSEEAAAEFQAVLNDMAGEGGMSATVMTAEAPGVGRRARPTACETFRSTISSRSPASPSRRRSPGDAAGRGRRTRARRSGRRHLPADLDFDTNGATIRHLLTIRSGLPDCDVHAWHTLRPIGYTSGRRRVCSRSQATRLGPRASMFEYTDTNYLLLGLIIEQVRGRPLARCCTTASSPSTGRAAHLSTR